MMNTTHQQPTVILQITSDKTVDTRISLAEWNKATDDERGECVAEHCAFVSDVAILTPEAVADGISACEASYPTALNAGQLTQLAMALNAAEKELLVSCGKVIATGDDICELTEIRRLWSKVESVAKELGL